MKNIFLTFTALAGTMMYGMAYAAAPDCDLVDATAAAEKCSDMGYVLTRSECGCDSNGNNCDYPALKCPFDDSKYYCYRSKTKVCDVGDVLFNDRRCYEDLKMVPANIKPIGVVFDAENKLAVELEGATNVAAVQSADQDLLQKYTTSSPRVPMPTYKVTADALFTEKPDVTLSIQSGKKSDGTPIIQPITMNKSVKMSALPELQAAFSTAEYSIGKAISGATTLIDYDSCECSYNIGDFAVADADIKYKKANLIEAPRKFAKELLDLQAQSDGKGPGFCPSNLCLDLVYPFSGLTFTTQHAVFEPYVENGTNKLRKFENFQLNGINVQNLRSDCAQIQACKNTALNYRSTSSTMGGWKDSNALYDWAAASQSGTVDIQYTGNYSTGTKGGKCECTNDQSSNNQISLGGSCGQDCTIYQGRRLKEMNITVVPHGAAKAAERCLALNGGEYTGLLAASGETTTSFYRPDGSAECDMNDSCHDIHVYTYYGVTKNFTGPDGDLWQNINYTTYDPPVNYNKWFLPSIGDLGVLGENIQKVNAGLADAARFIASYNYDPKHSNNKIDVKVNLIGINTPTIMKAVNGSPNPLTTLNPVDLKQPLKAIGARIRAAKSLEDMEYLSEAASLLPKKLLLEEDNDNNASTNTGSLLTTTSLFTSMKADLTNFVGKAKIRTNDSGSTIAGLQISNKPTDFMATKTSFFTNESLWSSTMGYTVEDYTGPDAEPAGTDTQTEKPYYTSVTKKGINNYDYTWFYRPLPRTGEAKFGVAQSWQTGDANRPRNVRCVYYYGASEDWD